MDEKNTLKEKTKNLWEAIFNKKMLICLFNGFTAGLPLYFLAQFIPAWLRDHDVDLKTIGFFSVVLLPYSFKYLWAPALDRYIPPFLGRRRGWMLVTQIGLLLCMLLLAPLNPKTQIDLIVVLGFLIGLFSATQDIALDAYRRELLEDDELGLGNSFYANAYRIAGFIPGGLGLILADYLPWQIVFIIVSVFMGVGIFQTLWIKELTEENAAPKTLKEAVIEPFKEFFTRESVSHGLLIIAFIFFYKFGDTVATSLITPFYLDVGFSKAVLGSIVKVVSLWSMIIGGFLGGAIMFKLGINKSLWIFGFIQLLSILGFAVLNEAGAIEWVLALVVAFEYLGVGLGSAALMAYIAANTNKSFTGTQLALLSSIFAIPKSFSGILSGIIIEGIKPKDGVFFNLFGEVAGLGYTNYFLICTALALPGMILLFWVAPWRRK